LKSSSTVQRLALGILVVLATLVLVTWQRSPIDRPRAWEAPGAPGYTGPHARNTRLAAASLIPIAPYRGPEHLEIGPDGALYTGVLGGAILRIEPRNGAITELTNTGGRPLGLAFTSEGSQLLIADAMRGLLAWSPSGGLRVLADVYAGRPILYADAVAPGPDGWAYLTDASSRHSPRTHGTLHAATLDIIEQSCTGRVLAVALATRRVESVIEGLCFPNGIVTSADGGRLFVAETGRYRIWSIVSATRGLDLSRKPPDPAMASVILANLPGFPDNLTRGPDGRLWTGLTGPRSPVADRLAHWPQLRRLLMGLPKSLWPLPPAYGHVFAFDERGQVFEDLQDPTAALPATSGATATVDGTLFIQSLEAAAIGRLEQGAGRPREPY
jgi:sugar lactone lactonase YvrE